MNNGYSLQTYNSIVCCELGSSSNSSLLYIFLSAHDTSLEADGIGERVICTICTQLEIKFGPGNSSNFFAKGQNVNVFEMRRHKGTRAKGAQDKI